ncbi:MAG: dihydrolipoyl dehydrogenase [Dehalococcoidales bacterium]|nr:dihydrolipoyl dehydrogenase [Dehalococcoidales bacterium]
MKKSEVVVVGGGPAGYVAAIRAAQLNSKVTIIEKDTLGGTCLNRGCIPTKALLHSVGVYEAARTGAECGVNVDNVAIDFSKMMSHKNKIVSTLVNGVQFLMRSNAIEVIKGTGKMISSNKIEIDNGQQESIEGARFILAPGSVPSVVPIPGINGPGVITSDGALQLSEIPESLVIIGGGVIGVEFATVFVKLGTKVTIVEMLPQIIPTEDNDLAKALKGILEKEGVKFLTNTRVESISDGEGGKLVNISTEEGKQSIAASLVLVAVGRKPNIEGLGLAKIGIKTERGSITVNERMETNIPGIYAAGDAIGGILLAHLASEEAIVAVENALGKVASIDNNIVPRCIYTMPEVAAIGLTESQAKEAGLNYNIGNFPFAANGKALILGQNNGFVKFITDAKTKNILGVHMIGPQATDLIAEAVLAVKMKATVSDLSSTIHAHPTLSEAVREAALDAEGIAIHIPKKR